MKHALELVKPLCSFLSSSKNTLFQTYYKGLSDERFAQLLEKIDLVIHRDARWQKGVLNMHMQKCFAVKSNINGLLDIARRAYTESVNDVTEIVKQLGIQYDLPLHLGFTASRGFFIQIACKQIPNLKDLPPVFLKVNKYKTVVTCTTEDLIKLNDRIRESLNEIYLMSDLIIDEVLNEIRENVVCLYTLTEAVSSIDFYLSLAHVCTLSDHVRPEFLNTLAIKNGRHPVAEKTCGTTFVPNNTFLCEDMNFIVLTGANMSGKTTYLKQVAVLQIMAQMGSYVPAEYASFRLCDQILSRMGSNCDIEKNYSSFILQMKEANYILQHATERSLIIMDELGKGTNYEEGCGIAYAICERLLLSKAFTICATHFTVLTRLASVYPIVDNYHLMVNYVINDDEGYSCNFTHTLMQGSCEEKYYGIKIAEFSTMPQSVVHEAKRLVDDWSDNIENNAQFGRLIDDEREKIKLAIHLQQLAQTSLLNEEELKCHILELKTQFANTETFMDTSNISSDTTDSAQI